MFGVNAKFVLIKKNNKSSSYSSVRNGLDTLNYHDLIYSLDIEDIYFFEVNTKYISSNVLKISVISRVRSTSEIADI